MLFLTRTRTQESILLVLPPTFDPCWKKFGQRQRKSKASTSLISYAIISGFLDFRNGIMLSKAQKDSETNVAQNLNDDNREERIDLASRSGLVIFTTKPFFIKNLFSSDTFCSVNVRVSIIFTHSEGCFRTQESSKNLNDVQPSSFLRHFSTSFHHFMRGTGKCVVWFLFPHLGKHRSRSLNNYNSYLVTITVISR